MIFKYEEMLRLRRSSAGEDAPRDALRALSAEFPGALRELDRLSVEEIEARLIALRSGTPGPVLEAVALYHRRLREALTSHRNSALRSPGKRLSKTILADVAKEADIDERALREGLGLG